MSTTASWGDGSIDVGVGCRFALRDDVDVETFGGDTDESIVVVVGAIPGVGEGDDLVRPRAVDEALLVEARVTVRADADQFIPARIGDHVDKE